MHSRSSTPRATPAAIGLPAWVKAVILVGFWSVPGLLTSGYIYMAFSESEEPISFVRAAAWHMPLWYYWALATPAMLWLGRRLPLDRERWIRFCAGHLLAAAAIWVLHSAFSVPVSMWLAPPPFSEWGLRQHFMFYLSRTAAIDLVTYSGVLSVCLALAYYRKNQLHELQSSELKAQLAQAQLQALRMQLHPHFLFNTLHAISVLVRKKANQEAVSMLAGLSDLLRMALDNVGAQEVTLQQELEFLERYLDLEQIRFHDRLRVQMDIESETLDVQVPNLILQPLVENAIRHGIAARASAGLLCISAYRRDSSLRVEVRDDGPGLPNGGPDSEGLGLTNTRKRLEQLYGDDGRLTLENGEQGGVVAIVEIPLRLSPA